MIFAAVIGLTVSGQAWGQDRYESFMDAIARGEALNRLEQREQARYEQRREDLRRDMEDVIRQERQREENERYLNRRYGLSDDGGASYYDDLKRKSRDYDDE